MATTSGRSVMDDNPPSGRGTTSEDLSRGLEGLHAVGRSLRTLGRFNACFAAASLAAMLLLGIDEAILKLSVFGTGTARTTLAAALPITCIAGLLCSLAGIVCLVAWERRRRVGSALFMRLSDELESRYRLAHAGDIPEMSEAEGSRIRGLFRDYLNSATLPFMPDESSGMVYLVFHVIAVIIFVEFIFHLV